MHSIRTKIIMLTVFAIVIAMSVITILSTTAIRNLGNNSSNRILLLLCETGQKNLNSYFESVTQSVETVAGYANDDLSQTDIDQFNSHMDRVKDVFEKIANNTSGILTYYYRIDPETPTDEKGFWYVNLDNAGFTEHEVTDITLYDTDDQSSLVWFTVPKATGEAVWLSPYFTENLDVYVLSYNVPIYKDGMFIGVIGIEIDYNTIVKQVNNITLYNNGYAFINDSEGNIIYHPHIDITELTAGNKPQVPDGLVSESSYTRYSFDGVEKQAVWLPLINGMRLNVTVPISEINVSWQKLIQAIIVVAIVLLLFFIALSMRFAGHITRPLQRLTEAAEQLDAGNYDVELTYDGDDEVGILTRTFTKLIKHLKIYISDLNSLAYADALTSVRNKGAFNIYVREMQDALNTYNEIPEFAVGIFDCNHLKQINDRHGHDKGDIYLQTASSLICHVFQHSPVFRIGGDEFAVILQSNDYQIMNELIQLFETKCKEINELSDVPWQHADIAMGIAIYDPKLDSSINDVVRRADSLMYQNKYKNRAAK